MKKESKINKYPATLSKLCASKRAYNKLISLIASPRFFDEAIKELDFAKFIGKESRNFIIIGE